jgi:drug/metabolite transporter (DMT)-like permease
MSKPRQHRRELALVLLLAATATWGATFVTVKDAVAHMDVLAFLAWRFLIAATVLVACKPRALLNLGGRGWAQGAMLGSTLAAGYMLQTFGLRWTSAAISGFLTGLQVVFVPLLAWLVLRQRPLPRVWTATALATAGLAMISLRGLALGPGELLTLASAAVFALQVVGLGRWSSAGDAYGLATVQLLTVAVWCTAAALPTGPRLPPTAGTWTATVLTAVIATAFAFVVQSWAQSQLSTARAAIVLTMEPVFAALIAWAAGEHIGWSVVAGGSLVVVAMLAVGATGWVASLRSALRAPGRLPRHEHREPTSAESTPTRRPCSLALADGSPGTAVAVLGGGPSEL